MATFGESKVNTRDDLARVHTQRADPPPPTMRDQPDEEHDPQFAPVHQLTEADKIVTSTHEEDEDVQFKMCVDASAVCICVLNEPVFGLPLTRFHFSF